MIGIIIYNNVTGQIMRYVVCPIDMASSQCLDQESFIEHEKVDDSAFKVNVETLEIVPIP